MSNERTNETVKKSPSSSPSSSYAYYWSNEKSPLFQTLAGSCVLFVFLVTWFASVGSPVLGVFWVLNGQYLPLSVLVTLAGMAYLPWNQGYVSHLVSTFARCNTLYYKKCVIIFQSKESIPKKDQKDQAPLLYAVHPHGAFCMGWSVLFCSKIMNEGKVKFCFSPVLYLSPLFRLWCRLVGRPGSAAKASMIQYMRGKDEPKCSNPSHLALPPGGFEEATISYFEKDRVFIKKRVGFVKLALQNGYNVVPVYTFGENQTYYNLQGFWKLRLWLNGFGVPAIMVFGSWLFPLMSKRNPLGLRVVVGDPVVLPTIPNPTREEVKLWHDKYVAALVRLFEEHKEEYYGSEISKTVKLELW
uniref:Acyltransferase n=1 Tax=Pseudo-nitzschia australis TaxID=44445 RepID=A0A7S4EKR3_9STRA|mmetsp:Transcript_5149/g.11418  ORF Transcript_5149/g.11418 Transcript_5149/m.11418 type:complete len:357 (-) Transcript_5149:176-1246(-)